MSKIVVVDEAIFDNAKEVGFRFKKRKKSDFMIQMSKGGEDVSFEKTVDGLGVYATRDLGKMTVSMVNHENTTMPLQPSLINLGMMYDFDDIEGAYCTEDCVGKMSSPDPLEQSKGLYKFTLRFKSEYDNRWWSIYTLCKTYAIMIDAAYWHLDETGRDYTGEQLTTTTALKLVHYRRTGEWLDEKKIETILKKMGAPVDWKAEGITNIREDTYVAEERYDDNGVNMNLVVNHHYYKWVISSKGWTKEFQFKSYYEFEDYAEETVAIPYSDGKKRGDRGFKFSRGFILTAIDAFRNIKSEDEYEEWVNNRVPNSPYINGSYEENEPKEEDDVAIFEHDADILGDALRDEWLMEEYDE